ncbi:MAG TPA: hypothetical protein DG761_06360 [Gammaproteobacteria bacterium]|jgi:hypothetical protein|nr:hypothetical protein [Acidiferrobacteraceae bacterium]MDP6792398.1 hypothetical protein [Arenicellales bacterium]MDP6920165.1 hypothetical protein [Arenicellales bacterium]HCX87629.1 hypothetical protein [Gammaproteobacteria bacterium]|tara:strand:- start:1142 stop:1921 length:780 start_codon:yes stop_codon:yes gene_type:complete
MTDPFARFAIEHLSATSMLQFRSDPALGILYLVFGIREAGSPAMHRGSALDHTIGQLLEEDTTLDHEGARAMAAAHYDDLIENTDEKYRPSDIKREREVVCRCLDECYAVVSNWDAPLAYQHPIRLSLQGIEVPVIGFIDLRYPDAVRELKSSGKPRSGIVDDHAFQVATYAMAIRQESGAWPQAFVDYLTPSGMSSYQLMNGKRWVKEVVDTAASIRTLLERAADKDALCQLITPDYSHWLWRYRPNSLAAARELFGE